MVQLQHAGRAGRAVLRLQLHPCTKVSLAAAGDLAPMNSRGSHTKSMVALVVNGTGLMPLGFSRISRVRGLTAARNASGSKV